MNEIGTFVLAAFGGAIAWFLTAFVGAPIRRFYDLRREVNRCLVEYGNVLARHRERRLSDDDGVVTKLGYDTNKIASELIGYSNDMSTYGGGRARRHQQIEKLLGISAHE